MNESDSTVLQYGFATLVSVCLAIVGWLWTKLVATMGIIRKEIQHLTANYNDYKLQAEQRFAKESEVNNQFERLHESMKSVEKDVGSINVSLATLAANTSKKP